MSLLIKAAIKGTGGLAERNPFHSKQFTFPYSNPFKMKSFTTAILMLSMAIMALKNGVQAGCMESFCDPWSAAAKHAAADSASLGEANGLAAAAFGNPDEKKNANKADKDDKVPKPTLTEPKSEVKAAKQKRGGSKRSPKFGPSKSSQKHEAAAAVGNGDN